MFEKERREEALREGGLRDEDENKPHKGQKNVPDFTVEHLCVHTNVQWPGGLGL